MSEEKYQVTGTVHRVGEMQTIGSKGFTKRELVLETGDKYKQYIGLECHKDKCSLLDDMNVGDVVTAHFNLNGRLWNEKCFNTLAVWKIQLESEGRGGEYQKPVPAQSQLIPDASEDDSSEIPF
jgi:hypothetical protein